VRNCRQTAFQLNTILTNLRQSNNHGTPKVPRNTRELDLFLKSTCSYLDLAFRLPTSWRSHRISQLDSLKSRLQASRVPLTIPRLAATILREEGIGGMCCRYIDGQSVGSVAPSYGIALIVVPRLLQGPLDTAGYNLGSSRRIIHYLHKYKEFSL
jgi:hypothetical protein